MSTDMMDPIIERMDRIGFEAIELPVDGCSPFVDLDDALRGGWRRIERMVGDAGLEISALFSMEAQARKEAQAQPLGKLPDGGVIQVGRSLLSMVEIKRREEGRTVNAVEHSIAG